MYLLFVNIHGVNYLDQALLLIYDGHQETRKEPMPDEIKKEEPKEETPQEPVTKEPVKEEVKTETGDPQKPTDWEKRYKDLQSTFNKRDEEVKTLNENLNNWKKLGAAIESDPERFNTVKKWLGVEAEAPKQEPNGQAAPDETKLFIRDQVIDRFEAKYGIRGLEPEKQQDLRRKVGGQLQFMMKGFAAEGEDLGQAMLKVPLNELPMYLENAYRLATADDAEEQARLRGMAEANSNNNGMIGSIPSSSAKTNTIVLTDKQKEAAKKLGISEKDYADYLKKEQ